MDNGVFLYYEKNSTPIQPIIIKKKITAACRGGNAAVSGDVRVSADFPQGLQ